MLDILIFLFGAHGVVMGIGLAIGPVIDVIVWAVKDEREQGRRLGRKWRWQK